ncbi:FlaD/FlaE family flagellar protein [Haloarchaeobius amylolyticus]|uniref:FlaD/FlaE family flagellar protein n=1 Tax=Haloarchaeobius amylolyticus TaxID=1198296 RepID=UPI0022715B41|nr:FlaD/FlaE family flagellar protein [Haloarchaeobius amylolyticus]
MGLRDILADFLGTDGNQARGNGPGAGQGQQQQSAQGPQGGMGGQGGQGGMPGQGGPGTQPQTAGVSIDELDQEEQIETLEQRIDGMEEDLHSSQNQLETIQGSQEQVADRIEDVNDTVRQLLGIYDQLTASANPFMEGGQPGAAMDEDAEGFGLAVDAEEPAGMPAGDEDEEAEHDDEDPDDREVPVEPTASTGEADADEDEGAADEEAVSFDDLKAEQAAEAAAEADHEALDDDGDTEQTTHAEDDDEPDNEIQVEATAETEDAEMSTVEQEPARPDRDGDDESPAADAAADPFVTASGPGNDATLPDLADTYATDIIVFEWMTDLVTSAGPAATLRAIAYYEEIGWISPAVKAYLEGVLSGPDLDLNVDPSRDPEELDAEDHAESYEYIMKLSAVQETMDDTGL